MKPRARPDHPLLWAIVIAVVASPTIELFKFFAAHQSFSSDTLPEQLGYLIGRSTPGCVSIFIVVALVLLVCRWITGAMAKAQIKASAKA